MTERTKTKAMANIVKVPGATLYYEVRGTGPVLLAIPGGPTDAGMFTALADQLAETLSADRAASDGRFHDLVAVERVPFD